MKRSASRVKCKACPTDSISTELYKNIHFLPCQLHSVHVTMTIRPVNLDPAFMLVSSVPVKKKRHQITSDR